MEASPPPGMWAATGSVTAKAPTLADIRGGSFSETGWKGEPQRFKAERRGSEGASRLMNSAKRTSSSDKLKAQGGQQQEGELFPTVTEEEGAGHVQQEEGSSQVVEQLPRYEGQEKEQVKGSMNIKEKEGLQQVRLLCALRYGSRFPCRTTLRKRPPDHYTTRSGVASLHCHDRTASMQWQQRLKCTG